VKRTHWLCFVKQKRSSRWRSKRVCLVRVWVQVVMGREEVRWLERLCVLKRGGRCFGRLSEHEHEEGKGESVDGIGVFICTILFLLCFHLLYI
jgi:hypothetical protein